MAYVIKTKSGSFARKQTLVDDVNSAQIWKSPGLAAAHAARVARYRPNSAFGRELNGATIVEIVMTTSAPVEQLTTFVSGAGTNLVERIDLRPKTPKKTRKGAKQIAPADFLSTLDKALAKLEK